MVLKKRQPRAIGVDRYQNMTFFLPLLQLRWKILGRRVNTSVLRTKIHENSLNIPIHSYLNRMTPLNGLRRSRVVRHNVTGAIQMSNASRATVCPCCQIIISAIAARRPIYCISTYIQTAYIIFFDIVFTFHFVRFTFRKSLQRE